MHNPVSSAATWTPRELRSLFPKAGYTAAIVGAASGIGRAPAELLAASGVRVALLDRNPDTLADAASAIDGALAIEVDATDDRAIDEGIIRIERDLGGIDALVNCAGITGTTNVKADAVDLDDFDRVYRVNLRAALAMSKAVLGNMRLRNYGRVLHVASIAGKEGNAGMAAYSATKAGLIGLVKSMAKDFADTGVTINALAPAVILTPLVAALPQATVDYMTEKIPMRRCGTLEEVAAMVAWIVSPACSFTTGFTFDLTGGRATY